VAVRGPPSVPQVRPFLRRASDQHHPVKPVTPSVCIPTVPACDVGHNWLLRDLVLVTTGSIQDRLAVRSYRYPET
jgi:hypothetical protein